MLNAPWSAPIHVGNANHVLYAGNFVPNAMTAAVRRSNALSTRFGDLYHSLYVRRMARVVIADEDEDNLGLWPECGQDCSAIPCSLHEVNLEQPLLCTRSR